MTTKRFGEAKGATSSLPGLRSTTGLTSAIRGFMGREEGNITIFSVFMFVGIVAAVGVGVDLMLNEKQRALLQNTLDTAILAAADRDQERDREQVVRDYFAAMGLADDLVSVEDKSTASYTKVEADARSTTDPLFVHMLGIGDLVAPASGTAMEAIGDVEISLVVDISGSMSWLSTQTDENGNLRSKISLLHDAAEEFIDTVLDAENAGVTTVNVVPYNHTVNLGSTLAAQYTLDDRHTYSNCVRFSDDDFNSTSISTTETLDRLSHFDRWDTSWYTSAIRYPECPTDDYAQIKVHQTDPTSLKAYINTLEADGNTAIDVGMKWAMALLDDDAQSVVTNLITGGHVSAEAAGRPSSLDDGDTLKVVVLMTDGENTQQYDLYEDMQSGMSEVFVADMGTPNDTSDDRYSVRIWEEAGGGIENDAYYHVRKRNWRGSYRYFYGLDGSGTYTQLSKQELYARYSTDAIRSRFFYKPYEDYMISWSTYNEWAREREQTVNEDQADARLATICNLARAEAVHVYTVAFEAPVRGVNAMKQCASSDSHFFDVKGTQISEAFNLIAETITQLRLTQ